MGGGIAQAYSTMGFCTFMKTVEVTRQKAGTLLNENEGRKKNIKLTRFQLVLNLLSRSPLIFIREKDLQVSIRE